MRVCAFGQSDPGLVRQSNEDHFGLFPEQNLYIVADGMGGHVAGEVASRIAVESMRKYFEAPEHARQNPADRLREAIKSANSTVVSAGECDPALNGMGTTIVAVCALLNTVIVGHVGDSRIYRYRKNRVEQLTQDHSLINDYVRQGLVTPEDAAHHPMRHVISRALGMSVQVEVEIARHSPQAGDVFLLCSDGLSNKVTSSDMHALLVAAVDDLEKTADALIMRAKDNGGEDNITVLLVRYG